MKFYWKNTDLRRKYADTTYAKRPLILLYFSAVDLFKSNCISETILRRLLKQDIIYLIKKNKDWRNDSANVIYQQGKPVDYFVLILEGRVEVTVGKENLVFESGPFTYFGTQSLVQNVVVGKNQILFLL